MLRRPPHEKQDDARLGRSFATRDELPRLGRNGLAAGEKLRQAQPQRA